MLVPSFYPRPIPSEPLGPTSHCIVWFFNSAGDSRVPPRLRNTALAFHGIQLAAQELLGAAALWNRGRRVDGNIPPTGISMAKQVQCSLWAITCLVGNYLLFLLQLQGQGSVIKTQAPFDGSKDRKVSHQTLLDSKPSEGGLHSDFSA